MVELVGIGHSGHGFSVMALCFRLYALGHRVYDGGILLYALGHRV